MDSTAKKSKKRLIWEIARFIFVGLIATACDYVLYWVFRQFLLPATHVKNSVLWDSASAVIATSVGFVAGLVVSWVLSVKFVFKNTRHEVHVTSGRDFSAFLLIALFGLLVTQVSMALGVAMIPSFVLFGSETFLSLGWNEWVLKSVVTFLVFIFNYFARKIFIFYD